MGRFKSKPWWIISVLMAFLVCGLLLTLFQGQPLWIYGGLHFVREIHFTYVATVSAIPELSPENVPAYEWFIISSYEQRQNWVKEGLVLPECDFSKNFLIISHYKINKVFLDEHEREDLGVPTAYEIFDKAGSAPGSIYIYRMPAVMCDRAVG